MVKGNEKQKTVSKVLPHIVVKKLSLKSQALVAVNRSK